MSVISLGAMIGLTYVPLDRLAKGIRNLYILAKSLDGRPAKFAESLINYFLRVWVNGSFPPKTWNMFQSSGLTTNNHAEAYNSRIGKSTKLGKHPNFYLWAESIISEPDQFSSSNPQTPVSKQSYRRVQGLKRRSDVSYSVSGANLRKKRRLNPGQSVSNLAADMNKKDYVKHLGLSEGSKMSLHHGQFVMESRLRSLNFEVLEKTPADGSCLFHSILDQISRNQELKNFAANHWELRWKIVSEGFEKYIKTSLMEWPDDDPECGSKEEWREKMLNPNAWGDQIDLHLASNLLELEIKIIPAFRELASDPGTGLTIIEPHITTARHGKIYIFHFSESDFSSPHYQSVWPRKVSQTLSRSPPSPHQSDFEVTEVLALL